METARKVGTNFGWKPLIEIPKTIPSASFIQGDDAQAFLEEFNAKAQEMYGGQSGRVTVLTYDLKSKIVRGSTPFAVAHADAIGKSLGVRVATMADLEKVLVTGALPLSGTYEDTALVLRSVGEPNEYLARNLAEQVEARGKKIGKVPMVVQLRGLQVVADAKSDYGLAFKLTDESEITEAPYLIEKNNEKRFNRLDESGAPIFANDGNRTLYTRKSGLSRLHFSWDLVVGSDGENLASSNDSGRVAFVRGEAAGADFVRAKYEGARSELADRMRTAEGILDEARSRAMQALYPTK
ncbi:hypothetical protein EXS72_02345 [Candidatus Pacearchaeota archaeon]|nr:hypothetical protein [Candidatus Pacearchaeota archaeon]